jgi:cytidyltransferase-like protein
MDHKENEHFAILAISKLISAKGFEMDKLKEFVDLKIKSLKINVDESDSSHQVFNIAKDFEHFVETGSVDHKKIKGFVEGVFDMTHFGHFNAMRQAKKLCDELVVAVNEDAEVLVHKGLINKTNFI